MDRYDVIRPVGKGSFGSVVLVRRKSDGREFVMKKMIISKKQSEKEQKQTQLEVELLAKLEHPGVVEYVESFVDQAQSLLCIVMAYCDGE